MSLLFIYPTFPDFCTFTLYHELFFEILIKEVFFDTVSIIFDLKDCFSKIFVARLEMIILFKVRLILKSSMEDFGIFVELPLLLGL